MMEEVSEAAGGDPGPLFCCAPAAVAAVGAETGGMAGETEGR